MTLARRLRRYSLALRDAPFQLLGFVLIDLDGDLRSAQGFQVLSTPWLVRSRCSV